MTQSLSFSLKDSVMRHFAAPSTCFLNVKKTCIWEDPFTSYVCLQWDLFWPSHKERSGENKIFPKRTKLTTFVELDNFDRFLLFSTVGSSNGRFWSRSAKKLCVQSNLQSWDLMSFYAFEKYQYERKFGARENSSNSFYSTEKLLAMTLQLKLHLRDLLERRGHHYDAKWWRLP